MPRDIYNETIISAATSGDPTVLMAGVLVTVNRAGTTSAATIYTTRDQPTQKANPFEATGGIARFWADQGEYDVLYHDNLLRIADQTVGWNSMPGGAGGLSQSLMVPGATPPAGSVFPYVGVAEPVGYKFLNGQSLSKVTFAALYAALGGASSPFGQDATTFSLPDMRARTPYGGSMGGGSLGAGLTGKSVGDRGGAETVAITAAQSGVNGNGGTNAANTDHYHNVAGGTDWMNQNNAHYHSVPNLNGSASHAFYTSGSGGTYTVPGQAPSANTSTVDLNHAHAINLNSNWQSQNATGNTNYQHGHALNARDADQAHSNMPPWLALSYIIRDGT